MALAEVLSCGLHSVERRMRLQGLWGLALVVMDCPRAMVGDPSSPTTTLTASSRPWCRNRDGSPTSPNILAAEERLYVAVVIDLFSRRVVGWSMNNTMTVQLVTDALMMRCRPGRVPICSRPRSGGAC